MALLKKATNMENSSRVKLIGFGMMFLSSSLMGGIGAFARFIDVDGLFISFCRNFAGFIGMIIIFGMARKFVKLKGFQFSPTILLSGVFLGLLSGLYVVSTQMTTLANAAFLIYTGPLISTLLATIFLREPFTKGTAFSLVSVVLGCLLIVGIVSYSSGAGFVVSLDFAPDPNLPNKTLGDIVALCSGVAYGLYLFFSRYRQDVESDVRSLFNFTFAVLAIGVMMLVQRPDFSNMTGSMWLILAIAAVVTGFGAFYFLTAASKILLAGELAAISYQETIMAALLGFVMFSETLTALQLIGAALIISGGVSQVLFSTKKKRDAPAEKQEAMGMAGPH